MDAEIVQSVARELPRYSEHTLRSFTENQIAKAAEFVDVVFSESIKLLEGVIEYRGYRVMSPEERVKYELDHNRGATIGLSELILVNYEFAYDGRIFNTPLYLPYMKDDVLVIDDTKYVIRRSITEKVFSRTSAGITMRVIRSPVVFRRSEIYRMEAASEVWNKLEVIPTIIIYQGTRAARNRKVVENIIHYLMCKFGYIATIARFGITPEECSFVPTMGTDIDKYIYFAAKKVAKGRLPDVYLKVDKCVLEDPIKTKLIASILYTVSGFTKHSVEDLYEPSGIVFRIMLAEIIHGVGDARNKNQIDAHISSTDLYLDPITRERLLENNIIVSNIYDLFQYVFTEIDNIHVNSSPTNMYNTRIDIISEVLVNTIATAVYNKFYDRIRTKRDPRKFDQKTVASLLRFNPRLIASLKGSKTIQKNPSVYGDNWLISFGVQKMRLNCMSQSGRIIGAPEHRFHPSIGVVETLVSFSDTHPGAGGTINPFLEITSTGAIIVPKYAEEIDKLGAYLPYK